MLRNLTDQCVCLTLHWPVPASQPDFAPYHGLQSGKMYVVEAIVEANLGVTSCSGGADSGYAMVLLSGHMAWMKHDCDIN